jgi:pilus assembly protein CpaC
MAVTTTFFSPLTVGQAQAQRTIAVSTATRTASVTVAVGKTEDVRIDAAFIEVIVGDHDVADVTPLTDRTLSILGKKIGTTRVALYGEGKRPVGFFDVEVSYDVSRLAAELRRIAGDGIRVSTVNGRIMLSGTSHDATTLDKAVIIARQFAPDIINTVQVLQPQQVVLEVRFVEATRDAGRELGVQWNSFGKNTLANIGSRVESTRLPVTTPGGSYQQQIYNLPGNQLGGPNIHAQQLPISPIVAAGVLSGTAPFGFLLGSMNRGALSIDVAINALEEKGLARSLAEPNLVALSGDTASFLAGGEYPIPVPGSLGTVTIDYKRYGVGLAFTPTVLGDGVINLKIEPEVSQIDPTTTITAGNITIPALIVRRANTTVELRDGQSFAIAGLLQAINSTDQKQLPWLADVPVLGALARSASYQRKETDLVIIVTPRIVRPARPGDVLRTPLDTSKPANDPEFFLLGQGEVTVPMDRRIKGRSDGSPPLIGHILDVPKGELHVSK